MSKPTCVSLTKEQQENYNNWIKSLPQNKLAASIEEDCCMSSPIQFRISASGIGDTVVACFGNNCIDLSEGD